MRMEIRLLGPVEALADGRPVSLGGPIPQAVLAALAMRSPAVVPLDELIRLVWGEAAPASAAGNVQTYISVLRRTLEPTRQRGQPPALLVRVGTGYQLRLAAKAVDIHEFTKLADAGHQAAAEGNPTHAVAHFGTALSMCRGVPLMDVPGPFAQAQRNSYIEQILNVLEAWACAMLELGRPGEVVVTLQGPAVDHPLRERLAACLIQALHESGRDDEALAHYVRVEQALREEFGASPAAELSALRDRLTGGEPTAPVTGLAPSHLPPDVRSFTGRDAELARMHEFARAPAGSPRLLVLHGSGGNGKTALAVHFGAEVADRFPDGRLYVDLRGFAPGGEPLSTSDAAGILLRAIGAHRDQIPAPGDARVAYLRTLLAGKQALLVLDNALDAAQVRPLLPGSDACLTIVTSRNRLRGLVVREGALRLPVGVLAEPEAIALFATVVGARRAADELDAVTTLVHHCGLMPLALRIVAERAAMRSRRSLAEIVTELGEAGRRLDVLSVGEETATLRTVFSWSYAALTPEHAHMFRLLGSFPGPDISVAMAAALAGRTHRDAERAIRALQEAHLLDERAPGYYRLHDLLRSYAAERFGLEEPESDRQAQARRLLGWYLHGMWTADRWLAASGRAADELIEPLPDGVTPPVFLSERAAADWCEAELPNALAVIDFAALAGFPRHAWLIPNYMVGFFIMRCHFPEWIQAMNVAVRQCQSLGDSAAEVRCRYNRMIAYTQVGRFEQTLEEAFGLLSPEVLRLEPRIRPYILNAIGFALLGMGRPAEAAERLEEALTEPNGQSARLPGTLASLGEAYTALGRLTEARERHEQALAIRKEMGEVVGQSSSLRGIGELQARIGDWRAAVGYFRKARRLARKVGAHREEALCLRALGGTYLQLEGRHADALDALSRALTIFDQLGDATADEVRAELRRLSPANSDATQVARG